MKRVYLYFVITLSLFIFIGCGQSEQDKKPKTKEEIMKSLTGGKDRSISEGFLDAPPPPAVYESKQENN